MNPKLALQLDQSAGSSHSQRFRDFVSGYRMTRDNLLQYYCRWAWHKFIIPEQMPVTERSRQAIEHKDVQLLIA